MKFLKNHKKIILITIIVIILSCGFLFFMKVFYPTNGQSIYGQRLQGIKDVKISEDLKNDVINNLKEKESTARVTIDIRGKIINIIIVGNASAKADDIKNNVQDIFSKFSDSQKAFYDMQIFVTQESVEKPFNLIGYKNKDSETIIWSSN